MALKEGLGAIPDTLGRVSRQIVGAALIGGGIFGITMAAVDLWLMRHGWQPVQILGHDGFDGALQASIGSPDAANIERELGDDMALIALGSAAVWVGDRMMPSDRPVE